MMAVSRAVRFDWVDGWAGGISQGYDIGPSIGTDWRKMGNSWNFFKISFLSIFAQ